MKRRYFLKKAINVARLTRLIAKAVDLFLVLILSVLIYPLGLILGIVYLVVADALQSGQSVGKKFIGFRVISLEDAKPCSVKQSFIRNLPIIIPLVFGIVPFGLVFTLVLGIPLILLEVYLLYKLDSGHRLGDVMADTTVMGHDGNEVVNKKRKTSWFNEEGSVRP